MQTNDCSRRRDDRCHRARCSVLGSLDGSAHRDGARAARSGRRGVAHGGASCDRREHRVREEGLGVGGECMQRPDDRRRSDVVAAHLLLPHSLADLLRADRAVCRRARQLLEGRLGRLSLLVAQSEDDPPLDHVWPSPTGFDAKMHSGSPDRRTAVKAGFSARADRGQARSPDRVNARRNGGRELGPRAEAGGNSFDPTGF